MISVAIDGPTSAGKSTVARELAERLGFLYVDTGACYRAIAYDALRNGVDIDDAKQIKHFLSKLKLDLKHKDGAQHIYLNGEDVTANIRTPEISTAASIISANCDVRTWLLDVQRSIAENQNVIMDGRDIGTVILPNADFKIFLTADPKIRAERRYKEYISKGIKTTFEQVLTDLNSRDERDTKRKSSPLKAADDAIIFDNSEFDFDQTVEKIAKIIYTEN